MSADIRARLDAMQARAEAATEGRARDLSGTRFGSLVVVRRDGTRYAGTRAARPVWLCQCDCGGTTRAIGGDLRSGHTKSCGCGRGANLVALNTTHGKHRHPLYETWHSMWQRCTNPNNHAYASYGGRGIEVCDRWRDFAAFLTDVGEKPHPSLSLDRIDNDGNYEPGNVRWATATEQANNRRRPA